MTPSCYRASESFTAASDIRISESRLAAGPGTARRRGRDESSLSQAICWQTAACCSGLAESESLLATGTLEKKRGLESELWHDSDHDSVSAESKAIALLHAILVRRYSLLATHWRYLPLATCYCVAT